MTKSFPYLAMDSAGNRTILCDYPVPMFERHKEKKMKIMSDEKAIAHAHHVINRLLAQDADLDDEGKARVKEFLKNKLSAADHETLCSMIDGEGDAQNEPPPDDVPAKTTGDNPPPLPG